MLILTEKPSVAGDFARTLGCHYSSAEKCFKNSDETIVITNCVGHLFELEEPSHYGPEFKNWKNLPVIPEKFEYKIKSELKDTASQVIRLLKMHMEDEILIATDADREGEIIARECLNAAEITDYSRIKRFWVSQALTPEVIKAGMSEAKALGYYDSLALQGFTRQQSDWLIGMNATRFVSNKTGFVLPVGRVQTAVLAAIESRCKNISCFKSEKYHEIYGEFEPEHAGSPIIKGIFTTKDGISRFENNSAVTVLNQYHDVKAVVKDVVTEKKCQFPPQLYSLNDLQKDAFTCCGYSAEITLHIIQKLYEDYKCVSYPRTPSRVMGSKNVELCSNLYQKFISSYPEYSELYSVFRINSSDRRIFNDSKLESHHAIIPLKKLPVNATEEEKSVYNLILERFMLAFAPAYEYEKQTVKLDVKGNLFQIEGRNILEEGWKKYRCFTKHFETTGEEYQNLSGIDWNNLYLRNCKAEEKYTKPPKHFNEASILGFMENPKNDAAESKFTGLGTPATRHIYIPKLLKAKYIKTSGKNIVITKLGESVLRFLKETPLNNLTDIGETTRWEEKLSENPEQFLDEIRQYISSAVTEKGEM